MWIIACFLFLGVVGGSKRTYPVVETKLGLIKGIYSDDGDYSMFLGIPYGKVDKSNPFGVATAYPKFEGTFLAHDDTVKCPQVEEFNNTIVGTLDCLHINIYVPSGASSRNKLPVLVWIYGGGFQFGFAGRYIYGPKYIVKHNVILVTLNYRLGPYGFMCLDIPEVPGNQGLKDQLLALRWINNNIESFGGDVNKVTLGGESAGAGSVESHLWSKQEKIFNQIILQSGSIFSPWTVPETNYEQPLNLAERLGYKTENLSDALLCLAKADVKVVIAAAAELSMQFRLCVEKEFENVERFVSDYPRNLKVPNVKTTRILIGHNNQECVGTFVNKPESEFQNMNLLKVFLKSTFNYTKQFVEMEEIVRHFYIGDEKLSKAVQWNIINFSSDYGYIYPIHESTQNYLDNGAEKVYRYVFSYSGERNLMKKKDNITVEGAIHADELSYLFDMTFDQSTPTKDDQRVIDMTTALWTNFIKYGDPTPETTELLPIKWLPATKEELNYLNINLKLSLGKRPFNDRMAFWKLFAKANKDKYNGYKTLDILDSTILALVTVLMLWLPSKFSLFNNCSAKFHEELPKESIPSLLNWKNVMAKVPFSIMFIMGAAYTISVVGRRRKRVTYTIFEKLGLFSDEVNLLIIIFTVTMMANLAPVINTVLITTKVVLWGTQVYHRNGLWYVLAAGLSSNYCFMLPGNANNALVQRAAKIPTSKMIKAGLGPTISTILITWLALYFYAPIVWPILKERYPAWMK